jgi:hypothetical protein
MTSLSLLPPKPSPKALPISTTNSMRMLLTERTSATVELSSSAGPAKPLAVHVSWTTTIVKDFVDYDHCGINE